MSLTSPVYKVGMIYQARSICEHSGIIHKKVPGKPQTPQQRRHCAALLDCIWKMEQVIFFCETVHKECLAGLANQG